MNQNISNLKITESKAGLIIQIQDSPVSFSRPITQDKVSQDKSMMFFQQLVLMEARAALRVKSLDIFKNDVAVKIEIVSLQSPQSVKLEKVYKAIIDGLNKNVINDDHLITNSQIWLIQGQKRYLKTIIKVCVEDLVSGDKINFNCQLPCIEKKDPVVYNIGAPMIYDPKFVAKMKTIDQTFMGHQSASTKKYEICHMLFNTSDRTKDVDNMFLTYIEHIRNNGYLDSTSNIGIGMYKRYVDEADEKVIVNLVSK